MEPKVIFLRCSFIVWISHINKYIRWWMISWCSNMLNAILSEKVWNSWHVPLSVTTVSGNPKAANVWSLLIVTVDDAEWVTWTSNHLEWLSTITRNILPWKGPAYLNVFCSMVWQATPMDAGVLLVTSSDWFGIDYTVLPSAQYLHPCLATKGMSMLKSFILTMPGCARCSSSNNCCLPCGGITPHIIQLSSTLSSLLWFKFRWHLFWPTLKCEM